MEYTLECPEFFLRTETCTGPISRFDAFLLASGRQCLALSGLSAACSARLLARLSGELNRSGIRVQHILSPDFPGKPEALLLDQLLILPDRLLSSPDARSAAQPLLLHQARPSQEALAQAALLRPHRDRLLRQGRIYLANGAAAREECRQAVLPDTDPRKLRRLGERLIAQELGPGQSAAVQECSLTALGAAGQQIADTLPTGWRLLRLEDPYAAFAPDLLRQLSAAARELRQGQLLCRCPLSRNGEIEHLFLPELRLGFVTTNHFHSFQEEPQRVINARRFVSAATLRREKTLLLEQKRLQRQSLTAASRCFAEAGQLDAEIDSLLLGSPEDTSAVLAQVQEELCRLGVL